MNPVPVGQVVFALLLAAFGSLFAAGDAALGSLPEGHLQALTADESPTAPLYRRYTADRLRLLSRWLVARVVCISVASALLADAGDTTFTTHGIGAVVAVFGAVLTYGTSTELLSTLARRRPEAAGALALRMLRPFEWAVLPFAEPLARSFRDSPQAAKVPGTPKVVSAAPNAMPVGFGMKCVAAASLRRRAARASVGASLTVTMLSSLKLTTQSSPGLSGFQSRSVGDFRPALASTIVVSVTDDAEPSPFPSLGAFGTRGASSVGPETTVVVQPTIEVARHAETRPTSAKRAMPLSLVGSILNSTSIP